MGKKIEFTIEILAELVSRNLDTVTGEVAKFEHNSNTLVLVLSGKNNSKWIRSVDFVKGKKYYYLSQMFNQEPTTFTSKNLLDFATSFPIGNETRKSLKKIYR